MPPSCWLHCLILVCLCWLGSAENHQVPASNGRRSASQPEETTSCDFLFRSCDNLANYCQCKDPVDLPTADDADQAGPAEPLHHRQRDYHSSMDNDYRRSHHQINQLSCVQHNLSQIYHDLSQVNGVAPESVRIDYLNINANLSLQEPSMSARRSALGEPEDNERRARLEIAHMSLQLIIPTTGADDHQLHKAIEDQMIDFIRLINETHLESLSIFLETAARHSMTAHAEGLGAVPSGGRRPNGPAARPKGVHALNLARLLAKLVNLSRLELSFKGAHGGSVLLEPEVFRHQAKLKWLDLASNERVAFAGTGAEEFAGGPTISSPFVHCSNLEYLSLASSNLKSFRVSALFAAPFNINGTIYHGQASLASLNLANNRLESLESDIFGAPLGANVSSQCSRRLQGAPAPVFLLPALKQLDLSRNRLSNLTFEAAQLILCTMPQLSQLYLQHNRIVHLNLNSLLFHPSLLPGPLEDPADEPARANASGELRLDSQLELIDMSHNHLVRVTAWPRSNADIVQTTGHLNLRVKSVNLGFNYLRRPLDLLDAKLINIVMFKETFDSLGAIGAESGDNSMAQSQLSYLETFFKWQTNSSASLCDHLSSARPDSAAGLQDELLNELVLDNNRLNWLSAQDLASERCRDMQLLRLRQNQIVHIDRGTFRELINLEQLDLSDNLITQIPSDAFERTSKLKVLSLSKNKITMLDKNLFLNLLELEELLLDGNELREFPKNVLSQLSQLNIVDLSHNQLAHLDSSTFAQLKHLKWLDLSGNRLREFTQHLFAPQSLGPATSNPEALHLVPVPLFSATNGDKQLVRRRHKRPGSGLAKKPNKSANKRQSRQAGDDVQGSNVLILSSNQLKLFRFDVCDSEFIENVQVLWLDNNELHELTQTAFKCFTSVQHLHLQSNLIDNLDLLSLSHMTQLESIDLSANHIIRIHPGTLAFAKGLRQVDLAANQLEHLNLVGAFTKQRLEEKGSIQQSDWPVGARGGADDSSMQLESLNLSRNYRLNVDAHDLFALVARSALRRVDLAGIKSVWLEAGRNSTPFKDKLEWIDSIDLSSVDQLDEAFVGLVPADKIHWSRKSVQEQDNSQTKLFLSFVKNKLQADALTELNLSEHNLTTDHLTDLVFANLTTAAKPALQLEDLRLAANSLDHWPFDANLASRLANLRSLDVSRNRLRYLVRNESAQCYEFFRLETLNLSSNSLISLAQHSDNSIQSLGLLMPRLRHLDLSHNRLAWVPMGLFDQAGELSWLELSHNQLVAMAPVAMQPKGLNSRPGPLQPEMSPLDAVAHSDNEDLILFELQYSTWTRRRLVCQPVDDYVRSRHRNPDGDMDRASEANPIKRSDTVSQLPSSATGVGDEDYMDQRPEEVDPCRRLLDSIATIKLDAAQTPASLESIAMVTNNRLLDLSLRRNGLRAIQIETRDTMTRAKNIVRLDLSHNMIESLDEETFCRDLPNLKSLHLNDNQLDKYPLVLSAACLRLNLIDLGNNKIQTLPTITMSDKSSALLKVIKLNNNQLNSLNVDNLLVFKSLRLLDLRSNPLKTLDSIMQMRVAKSLLTLITSGPDHGANWKHNWPVEQNRFDLKADDSSLTVSWTNSVGRVASGGHHNQTLTNGSGNNGRRNAPSQSENDTKLVVRYCTMSRRNATRVCLNSSPAADEDRPSSSQLQRCLLLRPPRGPSCLTDLESASEASGVRPHDPGRLSTANSSSPDGLVQDKSSTLVETGDPVLRLIEYLKAGWLQLKEVDLTGHLVALINVKSDSVWMLVDGKYPIHTLTLIRLGIVLASASIILLLVAMFALLTCLSRDGAARLTRSPTSDEMTELTNDTEASGSSSTIDKSLSVSKSSQLQQVIQTSSARPTGAQEGAHTMLERRHGYEQLAPSQLQHLHQQPCSTPSLSLAPSSVETAETMQAVDSIQSGPSSSHLSALVNKPGSVDQYAERHAHYAHEHRQQPSQLPIATVVRMVKSSSANFDAEQDDPDTRRARGPPRYGCNYAATLKSKIRAIQEHHHHQHAREPVSSQHPFAVGYYLGDSGPVQQRQSLAFVPLQPNGPAAILSRSSNQMDNASGPMCPHTTDMDPTTLSLLSINTALSGSNLKPSASQQVSPASALAGSGEQQLNLCQYHKLVHEQPNELLASGIILEQEEEQCRPMDDLSLGVLPPPPSPP